MVLSNRLKTRRVLPGFGLSLGFTLFYLSLIVLIPLSTLVFKTSRLGWASFWATVTDPDTVWAFRDHLTFLDVVMPKKHVEMGLREQAASLATVQEPHPHFPEREQTFEPSRPACTIPT